MKSNAESVDAYLEEVPEARKEALKRLRNLCLEHLRGYEEGMAYHMPSYMNNDVVEVAFASQKQHICVYILKHDVMLANKKSLEGVNHGKGCIRFSNPAKVDYDLIENLLIETVKSNSSIC